MKNINKILSVFLVGIINLTLCLPSTLVFASELSNNNEEIWETVTYDYVTKTEDIERITKTEYKSDIQKKMHTMNLDEEYITEAYNPGIPEEGGNTIVPFTVHGDDDRTKVDPNKSPYSRILALRLGQDTTGNGVANQWYLGTGFLEGPDVMATAGHNFWSSSYEWVEECRIYVRHNSATYGKSFYYPLKWTCPSNYTRSGDTNYDWCAVTLQNNLGSANGWFGKGWSKSNINGKNVTVSGYPSDKRGYQYKDSGTTKSSTTYKVKYDIDTAGGQSGSPVYDSNGIVWAIHTYSASSPNNCGNRITEWLYTVLQDKYLEGKAKWGV